MSTDARPRWASSRPDAPPPPPRRRVEEPSATGTNRATEPKKATARTPGKSPGKSPGKKAVGTAAAAAGPSRKRPATNATHRRRRLVLLGGVLAVLVALAWGVSVSPLLDVDQVTVRGASRLDQEEIEAAAGVHVGDALLWMDPGAAVEGIEALPYVRSATAAREWPDAVRITVRERAPVAWVDAPGGKKAVVDRTGRVLEEVDTPPGLPQLVGVRVVPPAGGTIDAAGAARVAGGLEGLARLATQSVEATDHGVVVHLVRGAEIRMGPPTQVAVKLRAAFAVLAASEGHPLTYVDVSTPIIPVTD